MNQMKTIILLFLTFCISSTTQSQQNWRQSFDQKYTSLCGSGTTIREDFLRLSTTNNAYDFMDISNITGALIYMYIATKDETYLNDEIKIINNIINAASVSRLIPGNRYPLKDDYRGWISKTINQAYYSESELMEGYAFRYITQFLYEIKKSGWIDRSSQNKDWYNKTLQFIEKNIWEKWIGRSMQSKATPFGLMVGPRTHMGSHYAFIALFLKELTGNSGIKNQCTTFVNMYDTLLKRNLVSNPKHPAAYVWNSSWDNTDGTDARTSPSPSIQDVSHGNHVIGYIFAAKTMNSPNWSNANISALCNTVKQVIFKAQTFTFTDNVDGSASTSRPGWGNSIADGWLKLGIFDEQTLKLFLDFGHQRQDLMVLYALELQYFATFALIEYMQAQ